MSHVKYVYVTINQEQFIALLESLVALETAIEVLTEALKKR